jgi:predicted metal-dependent phosphoesterase TrpH
VATFGPIGSLSSATDPSAVRRPFRVDLHVHSRHSGAGHYGPAGTVRHALGEPEAIYREARARGLDAVTLTDLDRIDGCLAFLEAHPGCPDFFISEEVTARDPRTGGEVHVLLYGLSQADHREVQRLRGDARQIAIWAKGAGVTAVLGPIGLPPTRGDRHRSVGALRDLFAAFDRFEVRNGAWGRRYGELVERLAREACGERTPGLTGGSGAHGAVRVGATATASAAADLGGFLEDLAAGRTWVVGGPGGAWIATADAYRLVGGRGALRHGLRRLGTATHLRKVRRHLDGLDVRSFQEKARSYALGPLRSGASSHEVQKT